MALSPGSEFDSTLCCENLNYCIINETSFAVQCCPLGSSCGTTCGESSYYSPLAATTVTYSSSVSLPVIETPGVCIGRKCWGTTFQCPESLGGQCCSLGWDCVSEGRCAWASQVTITPSVTPTATATSMMPTSTAMTVSTTNNDISLKIGLGVGIPTAVVIFAISIFVWRVRHAKRRGNASAVNEQEEYRKAELPENQFIPPVELETHVPEMPAQILDAELPEQGIVAELPVEPTINSREEGAVIACLSRDNGQGGADRPMDL